MAEDSIMQKLKHHLDRIADLNNRRSAINSFTTKFLNKKIEGLKMSASGLLEVEIHNPDTYGNRFNQSKIKISGDDFDKVMQGDPDLMSRFLKQHLSHLNVSVQKENEKLDNSKRDSIKQIMEYNLITP